MNKKELNAEKIALLRSGAIIMESDSSVDEIVAILFEAFPNDSHASLLKIIVDCVIPNLAQAPEPSSLEGIFKWSKGAYFYALTFRPKNWGWSEWFTELPEQILDHQVVKSSEFFIN